MTDKTDRPVGWRGTRFVDDTIQEGAVLDDVVRAKIIVATELILQKGGLMASTARNVLLAKNPEFKKYSIDRETWYGLCDDMVQYGIVMSKPYQLMISGERGMLRLETQHRISIPELEKRYLQKNLT